MENQSLLPSVGSVVSKVIFNTNKTKAKIVFDSGESIVITISAEVVGGENVRQESRVRKESTSIDSTHPLLVRRPKPQVRDDSGDMTPEQYRQVMESAARRQEIMGSQLSDDSDKVLASLNASQPAG